jgi:hypothetical protein
MGGMDPVELRFLFWTDTMWPCALEKYELEQTSRRFLVYLPHSPRILGWIQRNCHSAHPC